MRQIKFYLRTLIAQKSDQLGTRLTYSDIRDETGISTNTLSHIATNVQSRVDMSVLERLCDFFGCELHDLMRLDPPAE